MKFDNSFAGSLLQVSQRKDPSEEPIGNYFQDDAFTSINNKLNKSKLFFLLTIKLLEKAENLMDIIKINATRINSKNKEKNIEIPRPRSIIGCGKEFWEFERKKNMREKREKLKSKLKPRKLKATSGDFNSSFISIVKNSKRNLTTANSKRKIPMPDLFPQTNRE